MKRPPGNDSVIRRSEKDGVETLAPIRGLTPPARPEVRKLSITRIAVSMNMRYLLGAELSRHEVRLALSPASSARGADVSEIRFPQPVDVESAVWQLHRLTTARLETVGATPDDVPIACVAVETGLDRTRRRLCDPRHADWHDFPLWKSLRGRLAADCRLLTDIEAAWQYQLETGRVSADQSTLFVHVGGALRAVMQRGECARSTSSDLEAEADGNTVSFHTELDSGHLRGIPEECRVDVGQLSPWLNACSTTHAAETLDDLVTEEGLERRLRALEAERYRAHRFVRERFGSFGETTAVAAASSSDRRPDGPPDSTSDLDAHRTASVSPLLRLVADEGSAVSRDVNDREFSRNNTSNWEPMLPVEGRILPWLCDEAERRRSWAVQLLDEARTAFVWGVSQVAMLYQPECVLLDGPFTRYHTQTLIEWLRFQCAKASIGGSRRAPAIVAARSHDHALVLGALRQARTLREAERTPLRLV